MLQNKVDILADLKYALDELGRPPLDTHDSFNDETCLNTYGNGYFPVAYSKAKSRAETRVAHEAIEKGLKAILLEKGLSESWVRKRSHKLPQLLENVQQHNPTAFGELERCFGITIQYLYIVTNIQRNKSISDYFQKHGKKDILNSNRYASIENKNHINEGMIGFIYMEIIRALIYILLGRTSNDINSRIEKEARESILKTNELDLKWDVMEWLNREPVRPRLENIENLKNNKILRHAIRRCAKESKDIGIQMWAKTLRSKLSASIRKDRANRRVGQNSV